MEVISTKSAPEAIGPYSQAIVTGNLVYTSGQIPINPASGNIETDDISSQTEQAIKTLSQFLKQQAHLLKKS